MENRKGLYLLLKEANLIKEEKWKNKMYRSRMWGGEIEVITKDDLRFIFHFWDSYPSQKKLDLMWRDKFIPQDRFLDAKLVDTEWHRLYVGDHIYVSKKGFFEKDERRDEIISSIKGGTWENDDDLWLLI